MYMHVCFSLAHGRLTATPNTVCWGQVNKINVAYIVFKSLIVTQPCLENATVINFIVQFQM